MDDNKHTIWQAMRHSPASIVLMIYTFITVWFVGGLTLFHLYLISINQVSIQFLAELHFVVFLSFELHSLLVWFVLMEFV